MGICFRFVASEDQISVGDGRQVFFEGRQAGGSVFEGKSELAARPHDLYCTITYGVIP